MRAAARARFLFQSAFSRSNACELRFNMKLLLLGPDTKIRRLLAFGVATTADEVVSLARRRDLAGLPGLEEFEAALIDYPGPILAVSHDRWFIQRFGASGGQVWELRDGRLIPHAGNAADVIETLIEDAVIA